MELCTSFHKTFPVNVNVPGSQLLRRKKDGKLEVEVEGILDKNEHYSAHRYVDVLKVDLFPPGEVYTNFEVK